jgi:L-iditol 2-dehydrogenase
MKTAQLQFNRSLQIVEAEKPLLQKGGALLRVLLCGVCGSDIDKQFHRPVQEGLVLGHEIVGVIEELDLPGPFSVGQRVVVTHHVACGTCYYCTHQAPSMCKQFKQSNIHPGGFSEYISLSEAHLKSVVFAVPPEVSDELASLIEPVACCIRAIDRLPKYLGETLTITGLGFIGLVTALYAQKQGYSVFGFDINLERIAFIQEHYPQLQVFQSVDMLQHAVLNATERRGADIAFLSVVNQAALTQACQVIRDGGALSLFASSSDPLPCLKQNEIYFRELTVQASYSPSLDSLHQAADIIFADTLNLKPLTKSCYPLQNIDVAISDYLAGRVYKALIQL